MALKTRYRPTSQRISLKTKNSNLRDTAYRDMIPMHFFINNLIQNEITENLTSKISDGRKKSKDILGGIKVADV